MTCALPSDLGGSLPSSTAPCQSNATILIDTVTAVTFVKQMLSGKTQPSYFECETEAGTNIEIITKCSAGCERGEASLAMEVIAACLAGDLGLPLPRPYLVKMMPEFVSIIPDQIRRDLAQRSSPLAFGSTYVRGGSRPWNAGDKVSDSMAQVALAIFVFDAITQNPDRRVSNPNCLVLGENVRIIDHELAFFYKGILFWKEPWLNGGLQNLAVPGAHIFHPGLSKRALDFGPIKEAWAGIDDQRIDSYRASVPWAAASSAVDDAVNLIRGARDNIDDCIAEIKRVLA